MSARRVSSSARAAAFASTIRCGPASTNAGAPMCSSAAASAGCACVRPSRRSIGQTAVHQRRDPREQPALAHGHHAGVKATEPREQRRAVAQQRARLAVRVQSERSQQVARRCTTARARPASSARAPRPAGCAARAPDRSGRTRRSAAAGAGTRPRTPRAARLESAKPTAWNRATSRPPSDSAGVSTSTVSVSRTRWISGSTASIAFAAPKRDSSASMSASAAVVRDRSMRIVCATEPPWIAASAASVSRRFDGSDQRLELGEQRQRLERRHPVDVDRGQLRDDRRCTRVPSGSCGASTHRATAARWCRAASRPRAAT